MDIVPSNNGEPPSEVQQNTEVQPSRRRRKKSIVWEHFTVEPVSAGCSRACCKQCKKSFAYITGSKLAGTSHLKRHIALGICPVTRRNQEKNGIAAYNLSTNSGNLLMGSEPSRKRYRGPSGFIMSPFDQGCCNREIAKMIIQHGYPLDIVEQAGFIAFVRSLQPRFNIPSLNIVQDECAAIYLREKQNVLNLLFTNPGHVSITLDLWTSNQSMGYILLTGHFIDHDWKLHRRVLSLSMTSYPNSDIAFNHAVMSCLAYWNLEGKLFSLTLDHCFVDETVVNHLRGLLSTKNPLLFNGQLVFGRCYAHVLGRLAVDAIEAVDMIVSKVRENVMYVKTSNANAEKFLKIRQQLQIPSSKDLLLDDITRWDSTYHMLVAACELKEVFSCLDTSDSDFRSIPSIGDWKQAENLCAYLKLFFDAASMLTGSTHPTANTFFHEIWKIQLQLSHAATSEDASISNLTKPLQEKFDSYWRDCCLVLAAAVVMDPRYKMKLVEFSFGKIYGENAEAWIKVVDSGIREMFLEYVEQTLSLPPFIEEGNTNILKTEMIDGDGGLNDGLSDFDIYISEVSSGQQLKSELDQYLEESLLPRTQDFDVLGWWKLNKLKYPILSKMAGDILSIPISTVASDSVFSTGRKKLSSYESSLRPLTLEALVCAKDWLKFSSDAYTPSELTNAIVKMEC